MAILVLSRFSIKYFKIDKWFRESNERIIVFTPKIYVEEYEKKNFYSVKGFVNYDFDAAIELAAIEINKKNTITRIFAFDERDIERAGRLRKFFKIPGQQYESALAYRNKLVMKEILLLNGVEVPKFKKVNTVYDILNFIREYNYPIIIKPCNLYAAINTKKIEDLKELEEYLNQIDLKDMMIEKYISYNMVSYNGFVVNNKIVFSSLTLYLKPRLCYHDYLVAITVPNSYQGNDIINQYCVDVINKLPTIDVGPFHSELFFDGKKCLLCEIASRTAGGGINECIENSYGIKMYEEWAKSTYVRGYKFPLVKFQKYTASIIIPKQKGIIKYIPDKTPFEWVVSYWKYVSQGDVMQDAVRNGDKIAIVLVEGNTYEEIMDRVLISISYFEKNIIIEKNI